MWRRLISPSDSPYHEIAARGLHHAGRFGSVGVALAGESGVDRHSKPFPTAARRPFRRQDRRRAVTARVPHPKGGICFLEHPRPPRRGHHRARRASPGGRPPLGGSNPRAHSVLYEPRTLTAASSGVIFRVVMTSSTTPYSTAPSAVRMKSRSVSLDTRSRGWPVWKAISSSRSRR